MTLGGIGDSVNQGAFTNFLGGPNSDRSGPDLFNINPLSPPDMKTLVYAPEVRIIIAHGHRQYNVSKDLIRGTVIRKENSASSLFFTLANKNLRYNSLFSRMDKVTVFFKRIRWQQVFSGYLDTVPYRELYGGAAEFKATCTLKRLMHTWWNPGLPASMKIMDQFSQDGIVAGDGQASVDSGLGSLLRELLIRVGGWRLDNVHIENFPMNFWTFMQQQIVSNQAANQAQVDKFKHMLLGADINSVAPGRYAGYIGAAGPPGPPGAGEAFYIAQIVAACDALSLGPTTQDLSNAQAIEVAAATGAKGNGLQGDSRDAWIQVEETARNWYLSTTNNDAAILGVACAAVETGGGTTIRNLANPSVPDSLRFQNDGLGFDHDSVGIFQQRDNGAWGTVSQRMNPLQAATMFFDRLQGDWRNSDPGQAIYNVQHGASPALYNAAIPWATEKVAAYRQSKQAAQTTVMSTPLGSSVSSLGSTVGLEPQQVANTATSTPLTPGGVRSAVTAKPNPDSEGAVWTALGELGKPYVWGGNGPLGFDCSGLMVWAYRSIGKELPRTSEAMSSSLPRVAPSNIQRGDLIVSSNGGHVSMWLGDGTVVEAQGDGIPVGIHPAPPISDWVSVHHIADNGGIDPTAPRMSPLTAGPGMPVGTGQYSNRGTAWEQGTEPIARNLFAYVFTPDRFASEVAELFSVDHKEFIDGQPLIQMVQAVARAGLRNFASAPNGDFIAYYPDYFGLDGHQAVVRLEDIELKDVRINFSDDELTTHVYVAGDITQQGFDQGVLGWLESSGSVTVEHEWLFQRLTRIAPAVEELTGQGMLRRFGVRPFMQTYTMAGSHQLEFLLACQIFMEKWARQYQTSVAFTFMPELFPGMRVILNGHNLQVYVSEVTHTFDMEQGFHTSAVIMAPSAPGAAGRMLGAGGAIGVDDTNILEGLGFNADGTSAGANIGGP